MKLVEVVVMLVLPVLPVLLMVLMVQRRCEAPTILTPVMSRVAVIRSCHQTHSATTPRMGLRRRVVRRRVVRRGVVRRRARRARH
jgi:hypothetical protein